MKKQVKAKAPGKLILSGEYSAIYKMPAIVLAVNYFTITNACLTNDDSIIIELKDYNTTVKLDQLSLKQRCFAVQNRYRKFSSGQLPIDKVIESSIDLCCFIIGRLEIQTGIKLSIQSNIPIAYGFGSSAAFIVSVIKALDTALSLNLTKEEFYNIAIDAENLLHGNSSGIDLLASITGGCNYFFNTVIPIDIAGLEFFAIFTGRPNISTGNSVAKVKNMLETSNRLDAFKNVALNFKDAVENKSLQSIINQMQKNHLLLTELGVVPKKVQNCIKEIESAGGAAKISGSGAADGDNAGVLISAGNFSDISKIAQRFGYKTEKVIESNRGIHVI